MLNQFISKRKCTELESVKNIFNRNTIMSKCLGMGGGEQKINGNLTQRPQGKKIEKDAVCTISL